MMNEPLITIVTDRRQWSRFKAEPGTHFAAIWDGEGTETVAEVCNESLGGICLRLKEDATLEVGQRFRIAYAGEILVGTVRHVQRQADGTLRAGFECERKD